MSTLSPSGGPPAGRSRTSTVALVVVMAVLLFAAGVALSWFLRGNGGTNQASGPSPSPECTTTTAKPVALPKPGQVSVNVYNSTDRTGLAASTAATLQERGFVVGTVANDPLGTTVAGTAEIRYGPKGEDEAKLVQYYFAGSKLVLDDRKDTSVDVSLGEKFKQVRPQAAVDQAIAEPVVTTTGPGCSKAASTPSSSAS